MEMPDNLVWLDLEMTGLDPETCSIIEIAVLVTDPQLRELPGEFHAIIGHDRKVLDAMTPVVKEMHTKSGLIGRAAASKTTLAQAEEGALQFISKYCGPGESPLCGNSVHVDRRFLYEYMPRFNDYLHYRIVDVSTFKELIRRWYPMLPKMEKIEAHTAMSDIRESIAELKYYREKVFRSDKP